VGGIRGAVVDLFSHVNRVVSENSAGYLTLLHGSNS
jgi:hypothetical protein